MIGTDFNSNNRTNLVAPRVTLWTSNIDVACALCATMRSLHLCLSLLVGEVTIVVGIEGIETNLSGSLVGEADDALGIIGDGSLDDEVEPLPSFGSSVL